MDSPRREHLRAPGAGDGRRALHAADRSTSCRTSCARAASPACCCSSAKRSSIVLTVIRRPAHVVDRSVRAAMVTAISVVGPPLLLPSDAGGLVPDVVTAAASALGLAFVVLGKLTLGRSFGLVPANRGVVIRGPVRAGPPPDLQRLPHHALRVPDRAPDAGGTPSSSAIADTALILRALIEERVLNGDAEYQAYCRRVELAPGAGCLLMTGTGTWSGVQLINERTHTAVASVVEIAVSRVDRRRGLLGRNGLDASAALISRPAPPCTPRSCGSRSTSCSSTSRAVSGRLCRAWSPGACRRRLARTRRSSWRPAGPGISCPAIASICRTARTRTRSRAAVSVVDTAFKACDTDGRPDGLHYFWTQPHQRRAEVRRGVVPEFLDGRMAVERRLHDPALDAAPAPVDDADLAEPGARGGGHVFLHD